MGTIITLASQKGGVGKTTSAVNLAASLSLAGHSGLLLDFDPQGNATSGVGNPLSESEHVTASGPAPESNHGEEFPPDPPTYGLLTAGLQGEDLRPLIRQTIFPNLSVIPSSADQSRLDLVQRAQGEELPQFRQQVRALRDEFDYLLFDCPPSLGGLPTISLGCSDSVLIPIQCEYYAMEGLSQILPLIQYFQNSVNRDLRISGLLLTMFCEDLELSHEVTNEVRTYFKSEVFESVIPRDVILAEAASHGVPAYYYAPLSRGAWSYIELAKEVLHHA